LTENQNKEQMNENFSSNNLTQRDLYGTLGLTRNATIQEITKAYHKKAMETHPDLNPENSNSLIAFNEILQAYNILSNEQQRMIYDIVLTSQGTSSSICKKESVNPNSIKKQTGGMKKRLPPIVKVFDCQLEDIYQKKCKKIKIKKRTILQDGSIVPQEKLLQFSLIPGSKEGTQFCFKSEGDQCSMDVIPSDLVFVLRILKHQKFQVCKFNLVVIESLSYEDSVSPVFQISVETLDKRSLYIAVEGPVKDGDEKVIRNEGMPIDDKTRGDLIIRFLVN
jgi:DnaJ homolog subfamily B member 4